MKLVIYIAVMAIVTYLIRAIPFALFTKKITSPFLLRFLYYIPYAVLSAMTIPAIFYVTDDPIACAVGLACAVILALKKKSLLIVALAACFGVLSVDAIRYVITLI